MKNADHAALGHPADAQGALTETRHLRAALADWEIFARALPHELRAPLSVLDGFAMLLQEREGHNLSERGRELLERLRTAASHARSLADALLQLAPLSLQPIRRERVDVTALAREIMDLQCADTPTRVAEVIIQPALTAVGDPDLLRSLLANLLGNAWKYSATRQKARIELGIVLAADGELAFCVSDNGVGFDMEYSSRLFLPFQRLHNRSEFEGIGLGLMIARVIVERHNGRIWAESAPDQGARVFFRLGSPNGSP